MCTAWRQPERAAQRDPEKALVRIERVEKRKEIVLIGTAAVEEHEQARRLAGRGPGAANQRERVGAQDVLQKTAKLG